MEYLGSIMEYLGSIYEAGRNINGRIISDPLLKWVKLNGNETPDSQAGERV